MLGFLMGLLNQFRLGGFDGPGPVGQVGGDGWVGLPGPGPAMRGGYEGPGPVGQVGGDGWVGLPGPGPAMRGLGLWGS